MVNLAKPAADEQMTLQQRGWTWQALSDSSFSAAFENKAFRIGIDLNFEKGRLKEAAERTAKYYERHPWPDYAPGVLWGLIDALKAE